MLYEVLYQNQLLMKTPLKELPYTGKLARGSYAVFTIVHSITVLLSQIIWPCRSAIEIYRHASSKVFQRLTISSEFFPLKSYTIYSSLAGQILSVTFHHFRTLIV